MRMPDQLMTLSVRQPWAWLICRGGKNVENRTWKTAHTGLMLIHASKIVDSFACDVLKRRGVRLPDNFEIGGIVGRVRLMGCAGPNIPCNSMWAEEDNFHWLLEDRHPVPFIPCRGRLCLFDLWKHAPEAAREYVESQKTAVGV
jgi:hypothetical protein